MSPLCPIENFGNHELVICDNELSRRAHKELFHFNDKAYLIADETEDVFCFIEQIITSCNIPPLGCPSKIHMSLGWETLLKVSLWKSPRPSIGEVFTILRSAGVGTNELQPFKTADINDMFPWLYYGKKFDVLRKICHSAKKQVEGRLKQHVVRVSCHLFAAETNIIVASSL